MVVKVKRMKNRTTQHKVRTEIPFFVVAIGLSRFYRFDQENNETKKKARNDRLNCRDRDWLSSSAIVWPPQDKIQPFVIHGSATSHGQKYRNYGIHPSIKISGYTIDHLLLTKGCSNAQFFFVHSNF
jgi:hypothetical protein